MTLAADIKQRARELGFDLVGITTADPPPHAAQFQQWLANGFHGEMSYMVKNAAKRIAPKEVLPDARSIVVVGLNYFNDQPTPGPSNGGEQESAILPKRGEQESSVPATHSTAPTPRPSGGGEQQRAIPSIGGEQESTTKYTKGAPGASTAGERQSAIPSTGGERGVGSVARYAWGTRDYHEVMGDKLDQLATFIVELGGKAKWCVDTAPLLERDLAQRAGIGFVGKHTNLINRSLGNWLFLGEVLTNFELPTDPPEHSHCGTCRRCLDACPTGALVAPYQLDARRCISYLTIELKGAIPVELRSAIGDRVFGCDDCLAACPWNRFAKMSPVKEFRHRELPPLTELLSWNDRKFRDFFRGTPIFRIKRRGFLRNVCVALGNTGDKSVLPALERACDDAEPPVREHAAWAIEQLRMRGVRR